MTAWLIGAVTLILVVLILGRRSSAAFRRKTEEPKYNFLANIGVSDETIEQQRSEEVTTDKHMQDKHAGRRSKG